MTDNYRNLKRPVDNFSNQESHDFLLAVKQTYQMADDHAKNMTHCAHVACSVLVDGRPKRTCTSDAQNHAEINAMSFPDLWHQTPQDYETMDFKEACQWEKVDKAKQRVL